MSQFPPRPPGPPPVPVVAQPLDYAHVVSRKPGLVTAIGVMSIILGAAGILANLIFGIYAAFLLAASVAGPGMFAAAGNLGANGLPIIDRTFVIQAIQTRSNVSPMRHIVLDAFLADQGKGVLPQGFGVSPPNLQAALLQAGTHPAGTGPGGPANFAVFTFGRFDFGDDFVVFTPALTAGPLATDSNALPPGDIAAAINAVAGLTQSGSLHASHAAVLTRELALSTQAFLKAGQANPPVAAQLSGAPVSYDGGLMIFNSSGGMFYLTPVPGATRPAIGRRAKAPAAPMKLSPWPGVIALGEAVLSLALAIFLLVVGINTLRGSPNFRRHHYFYAGTKILLTGAGTVAWVLLVSGIADMVFQNTTSGARAGPALLKVTAIIFGFGAVFSVAYAVALLFTLRARSIRAYHDDVR